MSCDGMMSDSSVFTRAYYLAPDLADSLVYGSVPNYPHRRGVPRYWSGRLLKPLLSAAWLETNTDVLKIFWSMWMPSIPLRSSPWIEPHFWNISYWYSLVFPIKLHLVTFWSCKMCHCVIVRGRCKCLLSLLIIISFRNSCFPWMTSWFLLKTW